MLAENGNHVGGRKRICGRHRRVGMFSKNHQEDCSLRALTAARPRSRSSSRSQEESAGNKRRDNLRGNSFTAANRIHAFIGLRFKMYLLYGYSERFGQRLPHSRKMGAQLRLLQDN